MSKINDNNQDMKQPQAEIDRTFMRRAIELARHGRPYASPNPMVGAVIVHDGRIIGEGYHRRCGEGHAEVNAVASVADADRHLLPDSTIYVTLEPCSHYGKTPPCAKLLIDCGIKRVVIGSADPFARVSGRGIAMLREAGADVTVGVLEEECRAINPQFMTAHSLHRPWVTLKWAQSADGFIDRLRNPSEQPEKFSVPLTFTLSHRLRTLHDAIMVGRETVETDNPSLTPRRWEGRAPQRIVAARHKGLPEACTLLNDGNGVTIVGLSEGGTPAGYLEALYSRGITSVLVEGGAGLLQAFIDAGLWDMARVEISPKILGEGVPAPVIPGIPYDNTYVDGNAIFYYRRAVKKT